MRRLLIFRHSKAERARPGAEDFTRVLAEQGRADAALMGAYLARHGFAPAHALVSPAARTRETWALAGHALDPAPAVTLVEAIYDAMPETLLDVVKAAPAAAPSVALVGHNPGLHELALLLVASGKVETREALREGLPTSGLVIVDFALDAWERIHPRSGRLERFVTPRSLESAATDV